MIVVGSEPRKQRQQSLSSCLGTPVSTETFSSPVPDADALVNPTEGLEDEESSVFNEVLEAGHQEEVIHKNLSEKNS